MSNIQEFNIDEENELPKRKLPEDINMNLSVFRSEWSWKTWRGFWENIKWFFRAWKPAWHRATKGYCRMDTWSVDYSLTCYLIKVLTEYRNCVDAHPLEFKSLEEWVTAIDLCIDRLIYSMRDTDDEKLCPHYTEWKEKCCGKYDQEQSEEQIAIRKAYMEEVNASWEKKCEARKKAFEFLGEYLPHIWW